MAFAAAESPAAAVESPSASDASEFRVVNPEIDTWAHGTVSKVGAGELVIHGSKMPAATVHAQMRHDLHEKLAGVDDPQQRAQIFKQVKESWRSKIDAAMSEKKGEEKDMTFKPADSKALVILDAKSFRELPFFKRMAAAKERREKLGLEERDFVELYKARGERLADRSEQPFSVKFDSDKAKAAGEKIREKAKDRAESAREELAGDRLSMSDLKAGDKVFVGFDADKNTAFTIIRNDQPAK
jgi:bifunctional DNA-binding transcriptional regulator/antitoxin component of YhaV-PrlF toxin-antitoxin module